MIKNMLKEKTLILVIGIILGFTAGWFKYVEYPVIQQKQIVAEYKSEYEKMVFEGRITKVTPDALFVKITKGDTKNNFFRSTKYTQIQIANYRVHDLGSVKPDLTQYFIPNDYVWMLSKDGVIGAITRELRNGEKPDPGWMELQTKPGVQEVGASALPAK